MPLTRINIRPGINKQMTATLNEGGWSSGNLVRFKDGLPQPIGGWAQTLVTVFSGICRKLHSWTTLASVNLLAIGTNSNLYLQQGNTLYDITPIRQTFSLTNPYTTGAGFSHVGMAVTGHGAVVGDQFIVSSATVGGLTLVGLYTVLVVNDANHITFNAGFNATSTVSGGGGSVTAQFFSVGFTSVPYSGGYGAGAYGMGTYGTTRTGLIQSGEMRLWSMDHWGEELVACVRDGAIYDWKPSNGYSTRAAVISNNAPLYSKCVLTGMPERHLISFGAETGGTQDPMLIRWSDTEDYTDWTATATNAAGSFRIVGGSQIMASAAGPQEILVWTDTTLWAMRFEGLPYVYGFFQQGSACGLIAPNAAAVMNGTAYWMGRYNFYQYAGQVVPIPCTVWDAVFRNLNTQQQAKIFCAQNFGYNEISWFYPSAASNEIDSYVTVNVVDGTWSLGSGSLIRTAWEDAQILTYPTAAGVDGQIYSHEFGANANGSAMDAFIESGYFDIADGEDWMVLDQIIPDFSDQTGPVQITVKGLAFPDGPQQVMGPYTVTPTTTYITARMRARQLAFRLESNSVGSFWRLGALRARVAASGRKG